MNAAADPTDAVPSSVQSLLALFSAELATVRFPDLDHAVLARAADEVRARAAAVAEQEAQLEAARLALADAQDQLLARSQRALAYARVYAEDDDALAARLEAISLGRSRRGARGDDAAEPSAPAPKRGRPRKETPAPLFAAPCAAGENVIEARDAFTVDEAAAPPPHAIRACL